MPNPVQQIENLLNLSWSVQQKPGRKWAVVFRWENSQRWVTTDTHDKAEAIRLAPASIARWFRKKGLTPPIKSKGGISEAIARFIETQYKYKAPNTVVEVRGTLDLLSTLTPVAWEEMQPKSFEELVPELSKGVKPKTWVNRLSIIRRFWRWAVNENLASVDVTRTTASPPSSSFGRREDTWEEEYFEAIRSALQPEDRDILDVMRWTGLDSSDIATLRKSHILKDSEGGLLIVKRRQKAKSDGETVRQPIGSRVKPIIVKRMKLSDAPDALLFPSKYRDFHNFSVCLWDRVSLVMSNLGLPALHLKSLRHTFATYHIERGVPEDVLAKWLGHTPGSTTLRRFYLHRKSTARFMD